MTNHSTFKKGSLVCVSTGMQLGAHISPISQSHIENADIVFAVMSDGIMQKWVEGMNPNVFNMQQFYQKGKPRSDTYEDMMQAMLSEMRKGKNVVGAFYGHAGVFVTPSHKAIAIAKAEGYYAHMEPGISAEDCLFADCGINPGALGCANYEATQLVFYKRAIDASAYLILWQANIVGDRTLIKRATNKKYRQLLVDVLSDYYPLEHEVILYEAPTLAIDKPRVESITLGDFVTAPLKPHTTLVLPPSKPLRRNDEIFERYEQLEANVAHLVLVK
ncbi:SAM-dependent methyltransferase [Thalassotalea nanhaiensis]|uniref:SAM-dependent methyltransferase n=1 Tax=Thalassotalea nanhaiensis TaxID=3065648 RepID=A0ABY9TG32_9GAMM|nr:SAM-dependent methyltransferase [Colwelliaceae bacterium SQ345]